MSKDDNVRAKRKKKEEEENERGEDEREESVRISVPLLNGPPEPLHRPRSITMHRAAAVNTRPYRLRRPISTCRSVPRLGTISRCCGKIRPCWCFFPWPRRPPPLSTEIRGRPTPGKCDGFSCTRNNVSPDSQTGSRSLRFVISPSLVSVLNFLCRVELCGAQF